MRQSRRNLALGLCGAIASSLVARAWLHDPSRDGGPPTRGRGRWTTFGSVAVLGSSRRPRPVEGVALQVHGTHADHGGPAGPTPHGIWPEAVTVEVEVHNGLDRPLLFSPGQFRLRVGSHGPSVTPYDTERAPGGLPAGSTLTTWVSFLAPKGAEDLAVEFTEASTATVLSLGLEPTMAHGASS